MQSDNFGEWKLSTEFIRTSKDFQSNPIGTFFDPEKVYAAHKSGTEFKALQNSIRAGDYLPSPMPDIGMAANPEAKSTRRKRFKHDMGYRPPMPLYAAIEAS